MKKVISTIWILALLISLFAVAGIPASAASQISSNMVSSVNSVVAGNGCVKSDFGGIPTSGFMGTVISVGAYDITVSELGRYCYENSMKSHTLKLVDADGNDLASTTVSGGSYLQFTYGQLSEPVTLSANTNYYLVSEEGNGDYFSDGCDNMYCTSAATAAGYVKYANGKYSTVMFPNSGYLSLDIKFSYTPTVTAGSDTIEAISKWKTPNVRNDFHSYIGMKIALGSDDLIVSELGRLYIEGNKQEHNLKIVDGVTGKDIPGASATISGGTAGQFTYAKLEAPVTLKANHTYYLMSREYKDGDYFYEGDANFTTTTENDITILGRSYFIFNYGEDLGLNFGFVGINFKYSYANPKVTTTKASVAATTTTASPTNADGSFTVATTTKKTSASTTAAVVDNTGTVGGSNNSGHAWVFIVITAVVVVAAAGVCVYFFVIKKKVKKPEEENPKV